MGSGRKTTTFMYLLVRPGHHIEIYFLHMTDVDPNESSSRAMSTTP